MGFVITVALIVGSLVILVSLAHLLFEILVRLVIGLILAISCGAIVGYAAATGGFDGFVLGPVFALFLTAPFVSIVWRWRAARQAAKRRADTLSIYSQVAKRQPAIEEQLELDDVAALLKAWECAMSIAPDAGLDQPREACARFLKAASQDPLSDIRTTELEMLIRKHVPGLVADTNAVRGLVDCAEKNAATLFMIKELRALGDEAVDAAALIQQRAKERLLIRQTRLLARRNEAKAFS